MEQKNLRKTNGLPLYFGVAAVVLSLVNIILPSAATTSMLNAILAPVGVTFTQAAVLVISFIAFLVYPGIYFILLLTGIKQPRRGTAFAVVWIVFAGLGILKELNNLLAVSPQVRELADQLVPGGLYFYMILGLAEHLCVLFSCILFLNRLRQPTEAENPQAVNQ